VARNGTAEKERSEKAQTITNVSRNSIYPHARRFISSTMLRCDRRNRLAHLTSWTAPIPLFPLVVSGIPRVVSGIRKAYHDYQKKRVGDDGFSAHPPLPTPRRRGGIRHPIRAAPRARGGKAKYCPRLRQRSTVHRVEPHSHMRTVRRGCREVRGVVVEDHGRRRCGGCEVETVPLHLVLRYSRCVNAARTIFDNDDSSVWLFHFGFGGRGPNGTWTTHVEPRP
jgi:hypothetical protein